MMRVNWQDFPEMIRFCNDKKAILYLSYLKTPPRFALWNLPAEELRQIREKLNGQTFPRGNYVETSNAQSFDDFITFLQNAEKEAQDRDPSEVIPYSVTENDPYSYLPVSSNGVQGAAISEQTSRNEDVQKGYDAGINYRELLMQKLKSEAVDSKTFFVKIDGVMSKLPTDSGKNKVYYSMFNSDTKELAESVVSLQEDELLFRVREAAQ
jgi:hypothetical protein